MIEERPTISEDKEPAISQLQGVNEMRELSGQRDGAGAGPDALEVAQLEYHSPDLNQLKIITIPMTPTVPEWQESEPPAEDETTISTLQGVLEGAQNIVYEAREDTPGISFLKGDGTGKEWAPVKVMSKSGGEIISSHVDCHKLCDVGNILILCHSTNEHSLNTG